MGMEVFQRKEPKISGAHNIGAAISGPRIAGGKITDIFCFEVIELYREISTATTQRARKENLQRQTLAPSAPTVAMKML